MENKDEVVVEEETPVVVGETTGPTAVVEVDEETKTVTFNNGDTAPLVTREEIVAELGEEKVAEIEAKAEVVVDEIIEEEEIPMINDILIKLYKGKVILSEGTRTVNNKLYHTIRLGDGSTYDLTDEEYQLEVITQ